MNWSLSLSLFFSPFLFIYPSIYVSLVHWDTHLSYELTSLSFLSFRYSSTTWVFHWDNPPLLWTDIPLTLLSLSLIIYLSIFFWSVIHWDTHLPYELIRKSTQEIDLIHGAVVKGSNGQDPLLMVIDIDDLSKAKKMILKNHTNILLNTWNVSPKIPAFFIALKSLI